MKGILCSGTIALLVSAPLHNVQAQTSNAPAISSPAADSGTPYLVRELGEGKRALRAKQFSEAIQHFRRVLAGDPENVSARMGLADGELALRQYEPAELDYRQVVAAEPQMWIAHKNLVIVEAALGRWEEFDRERALLRAARERGADGISAHESDVIDGFDVAGKHWIVREYFEPVGRAQARYNFEQFAPDGRAAVYISLEPEDAAKAALTPQSQVAIGSSSAAVGSNRYALDWYTGKAHGIVRTYTGGEPSYERVRSDVVRFLRSGALR